MDLVLASQSPRRRELLALAGFHFTVRARPVEEQRASDEPPRDYVSRLAREKAWEAAWEGRGRTGSGCGHNSGSEAIESSKSRKMRRTLATC